MTVLLVVFMLLAFVGIDFVVRDLTQRAKLKRERGEREAILATSVRIEFAGEVKSLKRVALPKAKARILELVENAEILLLASHDFTTLQSICTRGIVFEHGHVIFDGSITGAVDRYMATTKAAAQ